MQQHLYFKNSKGDKLAGILSNPTGDTKAPMVVMAHGFASSKNARTVTKLAGRFDQLGISSFRIDIWGHGESEGRFEDVTVTEAVDDILQAIAFLKFQGYSKIGLIGSSFGGFASIVVASKIKDVFALALKSPVSDYVEAKALLLGEQGIKAWEERGYTFYHTSEGEDIRLNYTFYEDSKNYHLYQIAPSISIPTLIVHGSEDEEVPLEQSIKTSKLIPNCKLVIVKGAMHSYQEGKHEDEMLDAITEFIATHAN